MIEAFALLKRFWPYLVGIGLVFSLLIMRAQLASKTGALNLKTAEAEQLSKANAANSAYIEGLAKQRTANDAIASGVASKTSANHTREVDIRTTVERLKHDDPKVADWLSSPVPDSLRGALAPAN